MVIDDIADVVELLLHNPCVLSMQRYIDVISGPTVDNLSTYADHLTRPMSRA